MRLLSLYVTAKPLHNRCDAPHLTLPSYGQRPENVFNNKADFKVLLPDLRKWARNGPARARRTARARLGDAQG